MEDLTGDSPTVASERSGVAEIIAGRFRVRARLGRGATKEVYLAYDERLDREVALALVVGAIGNPAAAARITREAQVTGRLGDHPNVITVYDTGEHEGIPYLVLRAMPGGSLADVLDRGRPSLADALRWGRELAAALAHAHAHGVVHRDVKPDNVWLAADGSAALGDFGIAHQLGLERLTADGVVVGTVRYLSPEQIRGEEIGPPSDLYALGVTLYELVTGSPPFQAGNATYVLTQHLVAAPEPPSRREPAVPAALEALILALLAKDAAQRPASAADVADAIAALATGQPPATTAGTGALRANVPGTGARRVVSVLAARAGEGDPEALHAMFERATAVIEQHGGTVERYLGDGLVGFFGLTESHEDDALRAARAALELRETTSDLHVGIESGEVFLSAGPHGAPLTTGAPITAAGRLADSAAQGEILLGAGVRRAVGAEVRVDPATGRLLELHPDQPALLREARTPFVGRERELDELRAAFARACDERSCRLVTIAGPPGIGKSRLAGEFLAAAAEQATVLVGRCLAYGEGTTYRALADIVRGLGGESPRRRVEQLMAGDEPAVRGILGAIGLSDEPAQPEETAWALRRLLERLARERPVIVAVEDIHWAQPALLDLLEHVVTLSTGVPILLVCLTRPDLLESHPGWAAPQPNRAVIVLDALDAAHARTLAERLGARELAGRIAERAEGNPLFVEQLVAVDEGQATQELPASIQAVLAARIDRLAEGERVLLQHAAVEGRTFHAGALAQLLPEEQRRGFGAHLVALARKGLIGADQPEFPGEDAFRFTHALIREAAYTGLPKLRRAELHEAVARWLDGRQTVADEIVGFHLEQACLLARAVGHDGERERGLAARAAERLETASRGASARGDAAAASELLERAVALLEHDLAARGALLPSLGAALFEAGQAEAATRVLDDAIAQPPEPRTLARAQIERELVRLETETSAGTTQGRQIAERVLALLEREGDDRGQCRAWSLRARVAFIAGRTREADAAWSRAGECARRAGDERELLHVIAWRATTAVYGPTPVDEAILRCEQFRAEVGARPLALAYVLNPLAVLHAMTGEFHLAEELLADANAILDELGGLTAHVSHYEALVHLLAEKPDLAEAALRADLGPLEELGGSGTLVTTTAMLARAAYAQDRVDAAAELCRQTADATAADDVFTQVMWRGVQAKVLARQSRCAEAEALAREAISIVERTDLLWLHGDAMLDLAEALGRCARGAEREVALRGALALYERKGSVTAAAKVRSLLNEQV